MKVPKASTMFFVWCTLIIMTVLLVSSVVADECDEEIQYNDYNTVSFDVNKGAKCYPKFLTRIRNKVEAPTRACGLKSTRKIPLRGKEFLLVDLKISNKEWVTLGIDVKDLYIWGYQDKYNGGFRATFVNDASEDIKSKLFKSAVTKRVTTFKGNYISLQKFANIDKTSQALSVGTLRGAIKQVYGKPETQLNNVIEAKFFLLVIQMVSEATRFKFIEYGIHDEGDQSLDFKDKLSDYVNDWDKISNAIHKAEMQPIDKCNLFDPPIKVGKGATKMVTKLEEIKDDIALIKYSNLPAFSESDATM